MKLKVEKISVNFNMGGDSCDYTKIGNIETSVDCSLDEVESILEDESLNLYEEVLDFMEDELVDDEYEEIDNELENAYHYGFNIQIGIYENNKLLTTYYVWPRLKKGRRNQILLDYIEDIEEY